MARFSLFEFHNTTSSHSVWLHLARNIWSVQQKQFVWCQKIQNLRINTTHTFVFYEMWPFFGCMRALLSHILSLVMFVCLIFTRHYGKVNSDDILILKNSTFLIHCLHVYTQVFSKYIWRSSFLCGGGDNWKMWKRSRWAAQVQITYTPVKRHIIIIDLREY